MGAIYSVVHQCAPYSPLGVLYNWPSVVRSLPHDIHDHRHGRERTRRCAYADIVQVGILYFRRSDALVCSVSRLRANLDTIVVLTPYIASLSYSVDYGRAWLTRTRLCTGSALSTS